MRVDHGSPMVRLFATHLALTADGRADALALVRDDGEGKDVRRVFVPATLPCGDCAICRRGFSATCPSAKPGLSLDSHQGVDVAERYLAPIEDERVAALPPTVLLAGGLVATALDATARSGLGPGETAIWMGTGPLVAVGASLTAARACRTFVLAVVSGAAPLGAGHAAVTGGSESGEGVVTLQAAAGQAAWSDVVGRAEAASGGGPEGARPERRIYVCGRDPALAAAALTLAGPGATISFVQGAPATLSGLERFAALRIFIGGGYHPDLLPEALAALARGQVDVSFAVREIAAEDAAMALAALRDGTDPRVPIVSVA